MKKTFLAAAAVGILAAFALADGGSGGGAKGGTKGAGAKAGKKEDNGVWAHHMGKVPFTVGFEKGMALVKDSGHPPMYFFTTTWCGWCKKLAEESFNDDEIVKLIGEKFTPIIVDGDTEKDVCAKYGVSGYPKIVFAQLDGKAEKSVDGYVAKDKFMETAQDAAKSIKQGRPSKEATALAAAKSELDKALSQKKVKAAFAAIAKIEKLATEGDEADAAKQAKDKLLADGQALLDAAKKTAETDKDAARKAASALSKDYAGTPLAADIAALLKELGPAPEQK